MVIAACTLTIHLPGVHSLKAKRRILKSLLARLRNEFNLAVAEIDFQDVWQTACVALVAVGNNSAHLHRSLEHAVAWIEETRPDIVIELIEVEFR
jgi:uncharacterized protein YlxP (DUF503 family)